MNFVICNKSTDCFQKNVIYEWEYFEYELMRCAVKAPDGSIVKIMLYNDSFSFIINADKSLQDYIFGAYEKWDYDLGCVVNG